MKTGQRTGPDEKFKSSFHVNTVGHQAGNKTHKMLYLICVICICCLTDVACCLSECAMNRAQVTEMTEVEKEGKYKACKRQNL